MNGIVYYCSGKRLIEPLIVSVRSLRHYYGGNVTVFTDTPDMEQTLHMVLEHQHVSTSVLPGSPFITNAVEHSGSWRKGRFYHRTAKIGAMLHSPYDKTIWLDADTLVMHDPSELFQYDLAFTTVVNDATNQIRLNDEHKIATWTRKKKKKKKKKLERLRKDSWVQDRLVHDALNDNNFLINTGVVVVRKDHPFLLPWYILGGVGAPRAVCDQYTAIALLPQAKNVEFLTYRWNAVRGLSGKWDTENKYIRHYTSMSWEGSSQWKRARKSMRREQLARSEQYDFSDNNYIQ